MNKLRLSKLLPLAGLAVCGTTMAFAIDAVNTGTPNGSYTYVFNMPTGASYTLYTVNGPIGAPNSQGNGYSYSATSPDPYPTFSFAVQVGTSGINTNNVSDVEIMLQYDGPGGYGQSENYYFVEPVAFWANLGPQTFVNTGASIDGVTDVTGYSDGSGYSFTRGTVDEGATYDTFPMADPACVGCSVTTSFVPASVTPEPSSLALLSTGVAAAFGMIRRRRGAR